MKLGVPVLAAILIGQVLHGQEKKPLDLDGLCGRLDHIERIPDPKIANTFTEKRRGLRAVPLTLYERQESEPCCKAMKAIEATKTGRSGDFKFKNKTSGNFWLSANWNGREYKIQVTSKPAKNSTTVCSERGIDLDDDGNAGGWVTITVD